MTDEAPTHGVAPQYCRETCRKVQPAEEDCAGQLWCAVCGELMVCDQCGKAVTRDGCDHDRSSEYADEVAG